MTENGNEVQVVATELEGPSRRTLVQLRREGARFEVRHANTDKVVLPIVIGVVGAIALTGIVAAFMQYKPCCDMSDLSALGGLLRPSSRSTSR